MEDPDEVTLQTYEAAALRYVENTRTLTERVRPLLDRLADLVGHGPVLEIGSGPGFDAEYLESRGVRVLRSDATMAFVERLRQFGHEVRVLDARTAELGGPWRGILADAVLLHLSRTQFADFATRANRAVIIDGHLALTLKEGDGEGWSSAKLGLPRHFTYWREPALRTALEAAGWDVLNVEHVQGNPEPWLYVLATNRGER